MSRQLSETAKQLSDNEPKIVDVSSILKQIKDTSWQNKLDGDMAQVKWKSIYQILNKLEKPFDEVAVATRCIEKAQPGDKYYGLTLNEVLDLWHTKASYSMNRGSDLDTYIQSVLLCKPKPIFDDPTIIAKCKLFDDFKRDYIDKTGMVFVGSEIWVSSKKYGIRGRLDALFVHNDTLVIFDWKNTEEFKVNTFEKMLGPCDFLYKSDIAKFTLQLYLYKYILQEEYNIPVKSVRVIQFATTGTTIYKPHFEYEKPFMESVIEYSLEKQ